MPKDARADLLAAIEDEAGRLSRFVSDLLDMTRVEAGALAVRRDWVDLADVCRAAAARTRRAHPGLDLTIDLATDLPLAFADAGLLEQVLVNLLDNAAKYGAPPVELAAAPARAGVALSVTDHGSGIPAADQAFVFDKFTRAPRQDGDPPGAGLGLAIAQGMVVAMGGALNLESPVLQGKGTRFTVRAPDHGDSRMTSAALPLVLVVDDERQIQRFLKPALVAAGYRVAEALDGASALRNAQTLSPAVIILDLGLPDMDGKEVIAAVRQTSDVPIVVLSARDRETEKIAALDLGANDFVNKPFGIGELLARLRAATRTRGPAAEAATELRAGDLVVDIPAHRVTRGGELGPPHAQGIRPAGDADAQPRPGRHPPPASRGGVWGPAHVEDTQYLRVFVGQLRQKIETTPAEPSLVLTEPGVGYRFAES